MKALFAAAMLLVVSGVAVAQVTITKKPGPVCWLYGTAYHEGDVVTVSYTDDGGQHSSTWTCVNGQWR
jgi:hypothetical protein